MKPWKTCYFMQHSRISSYENFVFCHEVVNCNILFSWHIGTLKHIDTRESQSDFSTNSSRNSLKSHPIPTLNWLPSAEKIPIYQIWAWVDIPVKPKHSEQFEAVSVFFIYWEGRSGCSSGRLLGGWLLGTCWTQLCSRGDVSVWNQLLGTTNRSSRFANGNSAPTRRLSPAPEMHWQIAWGKRETERIRESCISTFHRKGPWDAL